MYKLAVLAVVITVIYVIGLIKLSSEFVEYRRIKRSIIQGCNDIKLIKFKETN